MLGTMMTTTTNATAAASSKDDDEEENPNSGVEASKTDKLGNMRFTDVKKWNEVFADLAKKQNKALREDKDVKEELKKNKMNILYISWSDVGRAKGSCIGDNITDMQFFAVSPSSARDDTYKNLKDDHFISFPAIRAPNFSDEVDIETAQSIKFKAKDIDGTLQTVTLAEFLRKIGHFIRDLPRGTDWSDAKADSGPMQVANQFSILPAPSGRVDLGIAAFGYQSKNLHIVIGPGGEVGWAPEARGFKRIFFRDGVGNVHTIALVPEDRKEVKKAFFKKTEKDESIAEEAKRYEKVENMLLHIQVEMKLPAGYNPEKGEGKASFKFDEQDEFIEGLVLSSASRFRCRTSARRFKPDFLDGPNRPKPKVEMDAGLNLARVKMGDDLGPAEKADKVPSGATRARGVACRVTKMFYAVAADGKVTQPRVHRFMEQMSFARRSKNLLHGSLVTGRGNWRGKAPIELKPLPTDAASIAKLIKQWPTYTFGYYLFSFDVAKLRALTSNSALSMNDGDELEFQQFLLRRQGKQLLMKPKTR
eukprot:g3088.t1